jgi:hypothetical protein
LKSEVSFEIWRAERNSAKKDQDYDERVEVKKVKERRERERE